VQKGGVEVWELNSSLKRKVRRGTRSDEWSQAIWALNRTHFHVLSSKMPPLSEWFDFKVVFRFEQKSFQIHSASLSYEE
jgi:hypothetical protein